MRLLMGSALPLRYLFLPKQNTQRAGQNFPAAANRLRGSPNLFPLRNAAYYAATDDDGGDITPVALRTAIDIPTRATPLKIRLMPTSVPIAHAELDGHCM